MGAQRGGESLYPRALDLDARRRPVTAVAQQVIGAGAQSPKQVEALDAAPRPLAGLVAERDQHHRAAMALAQARGHDSDHARVPVVGRQHIRPALAQSRDLRFGALAYAPLDQPALAVVAVELLRHLQRAAVAVGGHQLEARVGATQPPRGVQARRKCEGERARGEPGGIDSRCGHQRPQPRLARARENVQATPHERAVLTRERHHVGDGRQRDEVQVALQRSGVAAGRPPHGGGELVSHRRGAQVAAGIATQSGMHKRGARQAAVPAWRVMV